MHPISIKRRGVERKQQSEILFFLGILQEKVTSKRRTMIILTKTTTMTAKKKLDGDVSVSTERRSSLAKRHPGGGEEGNRL